MEKSSEKPAFSFSLPVFSKLMGSILYASQQCYFLAFSVWTIRYVTRPIPKVTKTSLNTETLVIHYTEHFIAPQYTFV